MTKPTPTDIRPHHRSRLALVYVRLAVAPHTDRDHAKLEYQRAQRRHAYRWGWSPDAVRVIDEDTGWSGAAIEGHPELQRLWRMIAAGQVGLLLVSDLARLCPSWKDLVTVLHLCQKADTLMAVDGCIVDWHEPVYLRHSTRRQCGHHAGSTERQREYAAVFGWPASTITPIDSVQSNGKTPVQE